MMSSAFRTSLSLGNLPGVFLYDLGAGGPVGVGPYRLFPAALTTTQSFGTFQTLPDLALDILPHISLAGVPGDDTLSDDGDVSEASGFEGGNGSGVSQNATGIDPGDDAPSGSPDKDDGSLGQGLGVDDGLSASPSEFFGDHGFAVQGDNGFFADAVRGFVEVGPIKLASLTSFNFQGLVSADAPAPHGSQADFSITTTSSNAPIVLVGEVVVASNDAALIPQTNLSGPLVNIDLFRGDLRFAGIDGSGYAVVILDTGLDLDHPFFGPDDNNDGVADRIVYHYDFADNDSSAADFHGHGSNVTSIALSSHPTYTGMAPGADIIHLKVFSNSGSGDFADLEQALQWVVANADAYNIVSVNMSLSDGRNYTTPQNRYGLGNELSALAANDVVVVSASGNGFYEFNSSQGVAYPAADPNSLAVGAVYDSNAGGFSYSGGAIAYSTRADQITPFSQRDDSLSDVFAPGAPITGAGLNGGTTTMHGTSQAAPHIAGVIALAQELAEQELGRKLNVFEIADLLAVTGVTINDGDDENDNVNNTGLDFTRVDVQALGEAILAMASPPPPPPGPPSLSISALSADKAEGDSGTTPFTFRVTRSGEDLSGTTSVSYAVTGAADASDFAGPLPSGTVDFASGETAKTVTIDVAGDTDVEGDEGFTVTLSNPTGGAQIGTSTASGVIRNDDTAPPPPPPSGTLLSDNFDDGNFAGWTVLDQSSTTQGPSAWSVVNQEVQQTSNIHGGIDGGSSLDHRWGTILYWDDAAAQQWQDYTLSATLRSTDNDGIGLVFHYQDPNNYYKVEFENQKSFSKLFLMENGVETTLATASGPGYALGAAMQVEVTVSGGGITVLRDGVNLFGTVQNNALGSGTAGLYAWANDGAHFDDVLVTGGATGTGQEIRSAVSQPMAENSEQDETQAAMSGDDVSEWREAIEALVADADDDLFDFSSDDWHDVVSKFNLGKEIADGIDETLHEIFDAVELIAVASDEHSSDPVDMTDEDQITLTGVRISELHEDDFLS